MKTQLQVEGKLYEAHLRYEPNDEGGALVLRAILDPPYPLPRDTPVHIIFDGHRVQSTTADIPEIDGFGLVWLEQRIQMEFERVPE